jgi:predicted phage terminase large subunit-like protein
MQPEGDKVMRMAAHTAKIEAGAVHIPTDASWIDEFKKEMLSFPSSRHDDQIDALSQALERAHAPIKFPPAQFGSY